MNSNVLITILMILVAVLIVYSPWRKRSASNRTLAAELVDFRIDNSPELAQAVKSRVFGDQDAERVQRMFDQFSFLFAHNGSFIGTKPEPAVIQQLVRSVFPPEHHESVLAALEQYGKKKYEQEKERVQLDIIKASGGDHTRVNELVKQAKSDFRDIAFIAENSNSFEIFQRTNKVIDPSTQEFREIQDADLRQFGLWLLQYVS